MAMFNPKTPANTKCVIESWPHAIRIVTAISKTLKGFANESKIMRG